MYTAPKCWPLILRLLRPPLAVNMRRNLRWLDFATPTPENIRVRDRDSARIQMPIDCRLVVEEQLFIGAVRYSHDVDVLEFRAGFAPVAVRQDMMTANLAARFNFATGRHR